MASLFKNLAGSLRNRLVQKFIEGDHIKVDRLMELHFKYYRRVQDCDEKIDKERQVIGNPLLVMSHASWTCFVRIWIQNCKLFPGIQSFYVAISNKSFGQMMTVFENRISLNRWMIYSRGFILTWPRFRLVLPFSFFSRNISTKERKLTMTQKMVFT